MKRYAAALLGLMALAGCSRLGQQATDKNFVELQPGQGVPRSTIEDHARKNHMSYDEALSDMRATAQMGSATE